MSDELQALCFLAGANSIFYGDKLLTTGNPDTAHDQNLFRRLKIAAEAGADQAAAATHLKGRPMTDALHTGRAAADAASGSRLASTVESQSATG
jgi:biotin synthase